MIQTSNPNELMLAIEELRLKHYDFPSKFKRFGLDRHCFLHFSKQFIGYNAFERYEIAMTKYLSSIIIDHNGSVFKNFLENIMKTEKTEDKKE